MPKWGTYINEYDPFASEWLKRLIIAKQLPRSTVDARDIRQVRASEVRRYLQCHWFGGIGGWIHALQLAGWDPRREVWTASCPCQPFSTAGKGLGEADERHLWPVLSDLVHCLDGKARRVEPGSFPLAHGIPHNLGPLRARLEGMGLSPKEVRRVLRRPRSLLALAGKCRTGRLRGYGNAIVPAVAAAFIRAFLEVRR